MLDSLFHGTIQTILNIVALIIAGWLYVRYRRTGGSEMMKDENSTNNHLFKEG